MSPARRKGPAPHPPVALARRAPTPEHYGLTARRLALQPPLHNGGHGFVPLGEESDLWRCGGCYGIVPTWALTEGFVTVLLGRWCLGLVPALPPTTT